MIANIAASADTINTYVKTPKLMLSNLEIVDFLKRQKVQAGFIDRLKITYRPYICPYNYLITLVETNEIVFDIGCGSGQFCLMLAEYAKPRSIYGIEISQQLVDHARELLSVYHHIDHSFETFNGIDFPDQLKCADVVFLIDVIHHVPLKNQELFINNLCDKMKPGARLVIKDINGGSPWVVFNKLHDAIFTQEIGCELSLTKMHRLLSNNGLAILSQMHKRIYVYPHYTIVTKK